MRVGGEERGRVGVSGSGSQLGHAGRLDHLTGIHHDRTLAQVAEHPKVVGDEDDGHSGGLEVAQQVEDLGLHRDVEGGRGLVGDQHDRVGGERTGDARPLGHAAGELVGILGSRARRVWQLDQCK
jgi:hypothetical protein